MTAMLHSQKNSRGFTLVELMTTVVIVAILSAIAVPTYQSYIVRQRISAGQSDLAALGVSLDGHLLNNTTYPAAANNTAAVKTALPGWNPVQAGDFSYAISAVDNTAFPPTYTVVATGTSTLTSGCSITLTSAGVRTKAGCAGGASSW